jgi:hypothetical protein
LGNIYGFFPFLPWVKFHQGLTFDLGQVSNWTKWIINVFFKLFFQYSVAHSLFFFFLFFLNGGKKKNLQHSPHLLTIWMGA